MRKLFAFTFLISLSIFLYTVPASCKPVSDSLAIRAEKLASSGDLKGVEHLIEGLSGPEAGALYVRLGHIFLEKDHLKGAEKLFRKGVTSKGDVAEAWYGIGLVYLRKRAGKFRAIEAFKKAVEKDHSMDKAELETARVYRSLGPLSIYSAKSHYLKALKINPDNYEANMELANLLEVNFRDVDGAMRYYRKAWNIRPTSSEALYLLADGYLEKGNYEKAFSILETGISHSSDDRWLHLTAMGSAYIGLGDIQKASELFGEAFSSMPDSEIVFYTDLSVILSRGELKRYRKLPLEERQKFERKFWVSRDPTPLTALNERKLEHYRRVWYARNRFSRNVYPWDNRGEVYVRYGEPDYKSDSNSPNFTINPEVEELKRKVSERVNPLGTDYTWGPSYPIEDNVRWERWVYLDLGIDLTFTDQVSNGRYIFAPPPPSSSILSPALMAELMESSPSEQASRAFEVAPAIYYHDYDAKPLNVPNYLATFKGDEGRTRLELYYGVIESEFEPTFIRGREVLSLESGIVVFDRDWNETYSGIDTTKWFPSSISRSVFIGQKEINLQPGEYHLITQFRDPISGRIQIYKRALEIRSYDIDRVKVSDLELASGISSVGDNDNRFIKNDLKIIPLPTRMYHVGDIAHIYFEIYNLRRGKRFGGTQYRVTYWIVASEDGKKGIYGRMKGLLGFGRKHKVGISSEESDLARDIPMHLSIDLSDQKPGRLVLKVEITDLNSNANDSREIDLLIR